MKKQIVNETEPNIENFDKDVEKKIVEMTRSLHSIGTKDCINGKECADEMAVTITSFARALSRIFVEVSDYKPKLICNLFTKSLVKLCNELVNENDTKSGMKK